MRQVNPRLGREKRPKPYVINTGELRLRDESFRLNRLKISSHIHTLKPRFVFRINNSTANETQSLFVRAEDGRFVGYGEGAPSRFFGEYATELQDRMQEASSWLDGIHAETVEDISRLWEESWNILKPFRAAQSALNIALWDLLAKRSETSVAGLALGRKPEPVSTFATIGLSDGDELPTKVNELRGFPLIKAKMDHSVDLAGLRYIREQTGAALAVDANRSWKNIDVAGLSAELSDLGVVFIEQPLPPEDDALLEAILPVCKIPVFADESCATLEDIERMPSRFSGFNIKLSKCGGLTPALRMLKRGRELGLTVMVGCRLESSLCIAAGAVVAQNADYADLDGAWLLANDPFTGLSLQDGRLSFDGRNTAGLGVVPGNTTFAWG